MSSRSRSIPITGWRGLNERRIIGADPRETSSLDNVIVRNGVVEGRKGMNEFDSITTAETDTPIIGLASYYQSATQTAALLRMTPTKVRLWNDSGNSWDDITGTALNGVAAARPQFANVGELGLIAMTNEGYDRPRKYSGSGNTSELGGTPPYCKTLEYYVGFLALGNISDDGSNFSPLDVILSDDPDNTWVDCSDTDLFVATLTLDESPGEVLALKVLGTDLMAYKSDAIVAVKFVGGHTRFQRRKMPFPMGILAPLSLQSLGEVGHIFLAQDRNLYINNGQGVQALPTNIQVSLKETMNVAKAPFVRSAIDLDTETYHLFYQRLGSSYMDGRLSYNYRTGEFYKGVYPVEFNSAVGFRTLPTAASKVLASSSTLTYELETTKDDNGTRVSRYFDIDWSQLGNPGNKYVTGGEFVFKKQGGTRVRISVGVDKSSQLLFPRTYSLKGENVSETEVRIPYQLPTPLYGSWFKFRVEMFHDYDTGTVKLLEFEPEAFPVHAVAEDRPNDINAQKS